MKPSFFKRLFTLASSPERSPLEDFTTEILAQATRHDNRPLVAALRTAGVIPDTHHVDKLIPHTQVTIHNVGRIDFVIQVNPPLSGGDIWLEIKVNAGETGDQLDRYQSYRSPIRNTGSILVTLSKAPLRKDVIPLTWQDIYDSIAATNGVSDYWTDFKTYLEEIGMADQYNKPLEPRELSSINYTYKLLHKSAHILQAVAEYINKIWPEAYLPTDLDSILKMAAAQFINNQFTIYTKSFKATLMFGIHGKESGISLGVWIEPESQRNDWIRVSLLKQADDGGLPSDWIRMSDLSDYSALCIECKISSTTSISECAKWMMTRIDELNSAGILGLIPGLAEA